MITTPDYQALLQTAIAEARQGLAEGGVPIGAALYHNDGRLLGCGHNRRVQEGDPSVHGETDAFRKAGRQRSRRIGSPQPQPWPSVRRSSPNWSAPKSPEQSA